MLTHYHLAQMCLEAYTGKLGYKPGYELSERFNGEDGLGACVYTNSRTNEMVIVFRGTDTTSIQNFYRNIYTDIDIAVGKMPQTVTAACDFVQQKRTARSAPQRLWEFLSSQNSNQLYLTGHSLGAVLAELVGYHFLKLGKKYRVVTFESTGCKHLIQDSDCERFKKEFSENFISYVSWPSYINTLHPHIGTRRQLHYRPYNSDLISKANYLQKFARRAIVEDILRLSILLEIIFCGISFYSNQHKNNSIFANFFYPILFLLVGTLSTRLLFYLRAALFSTLEHHSIDFICKHFNTPTGLPYKYTEVIEWPNRKQFFGSILYETLTWPLPCLKIHPNIYTLFRSVDIEEEKRKRIPGYRTGQVQMQCENLQPAMPAQVSSLSLCKDKVRKTV